MGGVFVFDTFFDHFSYVNYFHLIYGLKDIEFQSLNHFNQFLDFLLLLNTTLSRIVKLTGQLTQGAHLSVFGYLNKPFSI